MVAEKVRSARPPSQPTCDEMVPEEETKPRADLLAYRKMRTWAW